MRPKQKVIVYKFGIATPKPGQREAHVTSAHVICPGCKRKYKPKPDGTLRSHFSDPKNKTRCLYAK